MLDASRGPEHNEGCLLKWSPEYTHVDVAENNDFALVPSIAAEAFDNRRGDYTVSRGIYTQHHESGVGASREGRRCASDNRDMVFLFGFFASPGPSAASSAESPRVARGHAPGQTAVPGAADLRLEALGGQ